MTTHPNERPAILLTGFEPFGGAALNPSGDAALALDGERCAGRRIVGLRLPCVFGAAASMLTDALAREQPDIVLCLGLAPSRRGFSVERVALNLDDARIPDSAGCQPLDRPVVAGAPTAHFSTLPVKAMVAALHGAGLPAALSTSAGSYVCNHVFYALMHALAPLPGTRGGFIHLGADLLLSQIILGTRVALQAAAAHAADIAGPGGRID